MSFLAHSANSHGASEPLAIHLSHVAARAREYADAFGADSEAYLAGLLHDLGKYSNLFQRRLRNEEHGIDHWSAGAWHALMQYENAGLPAALAIQGHHVGLQECAVDALRNLDPKTPPERLPTPLRRLADAESLEALLDRIRSDGLEAPATLESSLCHKGDLSAEFMLNTRMLFSALVDSDFIETEAHFEGHADGTRNYRAEGSSLTPERALELVVRHIEGLSQRSDLAPAMKDVRSDLLAACMKASELPPGLFTLTAPTGSGKTLAMLAFALAHAARHRLRRVVTVIPYLSIIEQTAAIYRDILSRELGDDFVLEVHSLANTVPHDEDADPRPDVAESDGQRRRNALAENWDAPLVITTSVQCLESLFANRPSACRKLHRLAKSVILFDEVQTLPNSQIIPTLATLSHLVHRFGASIVFATATQPAFSSLHEEVSKFATSGWRPVEIVPADLRLFERTRRTRIKWPSEDEKMTWTELARRLVEHPQVLCVVNKKRHARELYEALSSLQVEGLCHLSTNMCPAHRRDVLRAVNQRLRDNLPCRLISTQCVEAGVDIDFPVVYRAFGPLDAIAQAAGRCNRHGRTREGMVEVFVPDVADANPYPDGTYRQAASVARAFLTERGGSLDLNDPSDLIKYYQKLYPFRQADTELMNAVKERTFVATAHQYRVIEHDAINVVVCYDSVRFEALKNEANEVGLTRAWVARARGHAVSLFRPKDSDPVRSRIDPVRLRSHDESGDWFVYICEEHYRQDIGLVPPSDECLIA